MGLSLDLYSGIESGIPLNLFPDNRRVVITAFNAVGRESTTVEWMVISNQTVYSYPKKEVVLGVRDSVSMIATVNIERVMYSHAGSASRGCKI